MNQTSLPTLEDCTVSEQTRTCQRLGDAPSLAPDDETVTALPRANTRRLALDTLKRRGPLSAKHLARRLGISVAGVRQHLLACEQDGIISSAPQRHGPGRPALLYSLTERGQQLFGHRYGRVALDILDGAHRIGGDDLVRRIFEERYQAQLRRYRPAANEAQVASKVRTLARLRSEDGFMADVEPDRTGRTTLVHHHCPIASVAVNYPRLCACELRLVRKILGPGVTVERTEHMVVGDRVCRYAVQPVRT